MKNVKKFDHINIEGEKIFVDNPLTELIVLGDSYSRGYLYGGNYANPNMSQMLASMLELNLHNYGVNGAGYTIPGNTFLSQALNAVQDESYDHARVRYIIVIGGINDVNNNPSGNVLEASLTLVDLLHQQFENAIVVLAPCWGAVSLPDSQEKIFRNICSISLATHRRTMFLYENLKALIGYKDLMGMDSIHPTVEGYRLLAQNIYNMMHGSYIPRGKEIALTALNDWNIDNLHCFRTEDSVRLYGYATPSEDVTLESSFIAQIEPNGTFAGGVFQECYWAKGGVQNYNCAVQFEPGTALTQAPNNGYVRMYNDHGNTVPAGCNLLINIEVPLLNF